MSEEEDTKYMVEPDIPSPQPVSLSILVDEEPLIGLVNVNENKIFHEPTCSICSSPIRSAIEQKFIDTSDNKEVMKLIEEESDLKVSDAVIDNHMRYHHSNALKELQKGEYVNALNRLNNMNVTTLGRIRTGLSAITLQLVNINGILPTGNLNAAKIQQIKSAETARLMNSFNQLLKLQASILGEMKSTGELIQIPRQAFIDFFNKSLIESENEEEKGIVLKILGELEKLGRQ